MADTQDPLELAETSAEDETLVSSGDGEPTELAAEPEKIGRYVLLHRVGSGGMGVVFAAYDPQLDRKVAIKLLKSRGHVIAQTRLQREAQALAKVDHPNVVAVHDVGVHEGQVFVAMDFVAGETLGDWMAETGRPRPWREVLAVFMAAGRGLAAAHARGLIHRDFKPDNVMIGEDGRVRVMDFGLVRLANEEFDAPTERPIDDRINRLTQSMAVMGTPAYMSFEQFHSADVDARSDQFSFCVALHEALYGMRPFEGGSVNKLLRALETGTLVEVPADERVPAWLRRVVVRGLAKDPEQRWPSMDALLLALADDPAPRRRRRATAAIVALLLAGASWMVFHALQADTAVCRGAADELAGIWDDERRAAVEKALLQTGLPYAATISAHVEEQLDARAEAWQAAWTEACLASARGAQSDELLDLRMACLEERRELMRATIDELERADATVLENAVEAVHALPSLERCADIVALRAAVPAPDDPELAERVAALDDELLIVEAKRNAGKYEDAQKLAARVAEDASTLDYEPLRARAWLLLGEIESLAGKFEPAVATLRRALDAALAQHMREDAANAAILLIHAAGRQGHIDEGLRWAELANSLSRAAADDEVRATYFNARGLIARDRGDYMAARDDYTHALALLEQTKGPDDLGLAIALNNLGIVADNLGEYSLARSYHERTLHIREAALAPEHPLVGISLVNLASVAQSEGKHDEARELYLRALVIFEGALGPKHPDVALVLYSLAVLLSDEGKYDDAREYQERALEIWEQAYGPEHPDVADALGALGVLATKQGKLDDARAYLLRSLSIQERTLGREHLNVGYTLANLGNVAEAAHDFAEAREDFERALALWIPAYGPEHPLVAMLSTDLGEAMVQLGDFDEGIAKLEQAANILATHDGDPMDLARTRFSLACALWDAPRAHGRDRVRARELVERVRVDAAGQGEAGRAELEAVDAWLASHER